MNFIRSIVKTPDPVLPQYAAPDRAAGKWWRNAMGGIALTLGMALYGASFALFSTVFLLELALPVVVLVLLVIWALPEARTGPVRVLKWLFFAFFIGMVLWPDYLAFAFPGLPWMTVRRLISVPLLIVLLICVSVSSQTRQAIKDTLRADPILTKLFLAFLALQFVSIFLSHQISVSVDKFIIAQLYWTTVFIAGCYVFRTPGSIDKWVAIFCLMLIPLAISGLLEWRKSQVPWAGHIPWFLAVGDEAVQRILSGSARAATEKYRVQSTSTTSLGYAEYMAMATPFLVHYVVGPFRPWVRLAALAGLPLTFFMIILTDTRLGVAGFMLSFIFYIGIAALLRWRRAPGSLFGPAITLAFPAIFCAFVAATLFVGRLHRMIWGGGEHQPSTDARKEQYQQGFEILKRNPFGYGIGRGAETLGYRDEAGVLTIDTYYLLVALEYGILGFLIYYAMLLWAAGRSGIRLVSGPALDRESLYLMPIMIALFNFIIIKSVFSQDANHPIVFMFFAMVLSLIARSRESTSPATLSTQSG